MTGASPRAKRRPAWGKLAAAVLVLAALAAAWRYTPLSDLLTYERMAAWARAARATPWAPFVLVAAHTPASFLMFPRPLLTLTGVIAFGPWLGFAYTMAGILGATLATYGTGRVLPKDAVLRLAGEKMERIAKGLRKQGVLAVFAVNMVPFPPFAVQGIIAGALRIHLWKYALGCLLGMAPGVLAATVFGNQIAAALEDPEAMSWWIMGAALVAFVALMYFMRRWASRRA